MPLDIDPIAIEAARRSTGRSPISRDATMSLGSVSGRDTPQDIDGVRQLAARERVELDLTEDATSIDLEWIARKKHGRRPKHGAGCGVLAALIHYADANSKAIRLSVYRGDPQLIGFYKQRGFEITSSDDPLAPVMVRKAQTGRRSALKNWPKGALEGASPRVEQRQSGLWVMLGFQLRRLNPHQLQPASGGFGRKPRH